MELNNLPAREDDSSFDYMFEKFSRDIDEFHKTNLVPSSNEEDFMDTFFAFAESRCNNNDNANDPSQPESIINLIQQDFEEFERLELPPSQEDHSKVQLNDGNEELEMQEMIDELRHDSGEFSITHDNNNFGGMEAVYGSCDYTYSTFGSGSAVRYFFCGQAKKAKGNTPRKRMKRKYRGVILSEEEAAGKMEENKIKNREAAAKAHDMKLAREAWLRSVHLKLRKKNEFLKKQIMFLEYHERINVPPKPLKRTISSLF